MYNRTENMQKDRREGKAITGEVSDVTLSVCVCLFHQQLTYHQADHIAAIITVRQRTAPSVTVKATGGLWPSIANS
jgi:hypothetical protein